MCCFCTWKIILTYGVFHICKLGREEHEKPQESFFVGQTDILCTLGWVLRAQGQCQCRARRLSGWGGVGKVLNPVLRHRGVTRHSGNVRCPVRGGVMNERVQESDLGWGPSRATSWGCGCLCLTHLCRPSPPLQAWSCLLLGTKAT